MPSNRYDVMRADIDMSSVSNQSLVSGGQYLIFPEAQLLLRDLKYDELTKKECLYDLFLVQRTGESKGGQEDAWISQVKIILSWPGRDEVRFVRKV